MSKFNINVVWELMPFTDALGAHFDKVVNDTKSFIGREEKANDGKNVNMEAKRATMSAKCVLKGRTDVSLALPLNYPLSILLRFGMQLTKIDESTGNRKYSPSTGEVLDYGIQSELPTSCKAWFTQMVKDIKSAEPAEVPAEPAEEPVEVKS